MKKLYFILLASLLVLGMAKCKKETHEMVPINLTVKGNEQKCDIGSSYYFPTALIYYNIGDFLYVSSNGKYVGYLTCINYAGAAPDEGHRYFSGYIDASSVEEGQPLQFIYLGGQDVTESLELGSTTQYTYSLAHQHPHPAVVSCGTSVEKYTGPGSYSTYMINQCALVRFTMNTHTKQVVTISGVKNELKVNFDGTVETTSTIGDIETAPYSDYFLLDYTYEVRYAVVPADQGIVENGTVSAPNYTGTFTIPSAAYVNAYIKDGTMTLTQTGSAPFGEYSVDWDRRVNFSPGNLQATWDGSAWSWAFAEHQWDHIGNGHANTSITGNGHISGTGTVDLFGWSSLSNYFGITPSIRCDEYYNDYAGDFLDWGINTIYNPATQQNDDGGKWRTLTRDEWAFLLYMRIDWGTSLDPYGDEESHWAGGYKSFMLGTITTESGAMHKGLIIFPDYYTGEGLKGTYVFNHKTNDWNTVTAEDWQRMEDDGAVLLPITGVRYGSELWPNTLGTGAYASATPDNNEYNRNHINFNDQAQINPVGYFDYVYGSFQRRYYGLAVRLVTGGVEPTPPTVVTIKVSNTDSNYSTATCRSCVTNGGGVPVTQRGVCWSTTPHPNPAMSQYNGCITSDGQGTGFFNSNMTGLTIGTTYYVRAYATNSMGTSFGNELSVTMEGLPTVTTDDPSNIGHAHALCGGEITDDGGHTVTAYGLQWSWSSDMSPLMGSIDYGDCPSIPYGFHGIQISDLDVATTYYVRAYATNSQGTGYGEVKEFTTLCDEDCDVPHTFSIGHCRKVLFAPGNLVFDPNLAGGWCFASEQWSYEGSCSVGSRVDLFNWGYWNYDEPYGSDGAYSDFGTNEFTLTSDEYTWFTLSKEEWAYLLNREKTIGRSTIKLCGYAKVNNINGLVLLPDDWDGTANSDFNDFSTNHDIQHGSWECDENYPENDWYCDYHIKDADVAASTYTDCNTIDYDTWNNMAAAGAVFLPATGTYREYDCNQGSFSVKGAGTDLGYWSSTPNSPYSGGPNNVIGGAMTDFSSNPGGVSYCDPNEVGILHEAEIQKMAVRLVRDACTWNWKGGK